MFMPFLNVGRRLAVRKFHRFGLRRIAMPVTMSNTEKKEQLEHDPHINVVIQERCPK
jgi:hypothetical protein